MPPERAWEFISAIAAGVGAAHRQNIVHRDLKPLNIMVQDDAPIAEGLKILDFGLAKIKSGELLGSFVQAQTSGLMGSPFYMAPEQWSDEEPDARADIYSLGVILYQMLAGEVPFKGSSIPSIMKKHLTMPPPSFQSMGVSIPPTIEAVVRHALEKEVSARIDSVSTFLTELHAALNAVPVAPALRETASLDPNRTIASITPPAAPPPKLTATQHPDLTRTQRPVSNDTSFGVSIDSLPGRVSGSQIDKGLADNRQQRERDQREKEQQEKIERISLQAKELEDRLERLSGSMPPELDPESTRLQSNAKNAEAAAKVAAAIPPSPRTAMVVDFAPKRRGLPLALIAVAVLVLILGGGGLGAFLLITRKSDGPGPQPSPTPAIGGQTKADLVAINGGSFLMGRTSGPPQETPSHPVTVPSFEMDRTEVTNAEYADFVSVKQYAAPAHWNGPRPPFGQELWPVVNVSFEDAVTFASWRSGRDGVTYRLPTEQEWEYAARNGERGDLYPWGPDWKEGVAVLKEATPTPVGSRAGGKNAWGVFDLVGNVWEWTSSTVSVYPGNPVVVPSSTRDWIAIRGGCYVSDPGKADTPVSSCMREFVPPRTKTTLLGFRLVRSVP
jgi:formylglycine-generating enzyme required for sulfatase activity